jgi:hypothetical protein
MNHKSELWPTIGALGTMYSDKTYNATILSLLCFPIAQFKTLGI